MSAGSHPTALVDTDVLIAHLRGREAARDWLLQARGRGVLAVSAVTIAEIVGGMRSAERAEVRALLRSFDCRPVTQEMAYLAGEFSRQYRQSHQGIGIADYLIAATAQAERLQLETLNIRHFPMFSDLRAPFVL